MAVREEIGRSEAARLFHALSDETRLEILEHLRSGEQCVCDLMESVGAAQSRLSFHLKVLKDARLICDRPEGRWVYYSLNEEGVRALEEVARTLKERPARKASRSRCC
jgi:ArsR family transcriptional regulator, arsenate/arsenite/antimonite-responsive transcriptional repressor